MRIPGLLLASTVLLAPCFVQAQPLKVVEVSAPAINCVFQTDCNIPVTDSTGNILFATINPGEACGWIHGKCTAAILDTDTGEVENITL